MPDQLIEIYPTIPASLTRLPELARNLFFSWHRPTRALFEDLEPELWQQVGGNLLLMLRCINQENLDRAAADRIYLERYRQVVESFDAYLSAPQRADEPLVAYFCAEYGFHESFPIYSGGLGILAGDHCKAASDERLNFVAVGLLYTQGYFIQSVDSDGVQHASNIETDPRDLPVEAVRNADGSWMQVTVRIAGRNVVARIWKAHVGRVSVYLLDTNCKENASEDREITHRLYGGDAAVRIRQEMILGLGGVRALRALGMAPAVWHMNEGHAAFLILELVREGVAAGLDFSAALESAATQCVFTTHTPVAAGHDAFDVGLFTHCFQDLHTELGVSAERLFELGKRAQCPCLQHDQPGAQWRAPHEWREPHSRRGVVAAVRRSLAGSAAGAESGRLRHQRRTRADLPVADLEPLFRWRARCGVARAPVGHGFLVRTHQGAGLPISGTRRSRSRRACSTACERACGASIAPRISTRHSCAALRACWIPSSPMS